MRALIIAALLAAGPAVADQVARNGDAELRLQGSVCSHAGTLAQLKPEWRDKFRNARFIKGGTILAYACWIEDEDGYVVIYEDGSDMTYPTQLFKIEGA